MAKPGNTPERRRRLAARAAVHMLRPAVFARDRYRCAYCGSPRHKLRVDHATPVSRGGSDLIENLVTACEHCDTLKANMTAAEFEEMPRSADWRATPGTRP